MSVAKAVLLGFQGYERTISVPDPPPPEMLVPVERPTLLVYEDEDVCSPRFSVRRFRLRRDTRSLEVRHRWEKLYNEGRTCTLEPGYVYMEEAS